MRKLTAGIFIGAGVLGFLTLVISFSTFLYNLPEISQKSLNLSLIGAFIYFLIAWLDRDGNISEHL